MNDPTEFLVVARFTVYAPNANAAGDRLREHFPIIQDSEAIAQMDVLNVCNNDLTGAIPPANHTGAIRSLEHSGNMFGIASNKYQDTIDILKLLNNG